MAISKTNKNRKYVANYFFIAEEIIKKFKPDVIVTMQFGCCFRTRRKISRIWDF